MQPVMTMFPGTWKDIRPGRKSFSPRKFRQIDAWKASEERGTSLWMICTVVKRFRGPDLVLGEGLVLVAGLVCDDDGAGSF